MVVFAAALSGAAAGRFVAVRRRLRTGIQPDTSPALELVLAAAVGLLGVSLAAYLLLR